MGGVVGGPPQESRTARQAIAGIIRAFRNDFARFMNIFDRSPVLIRSRGNVDQLETARCRIRNARNRVDSATRHVERGFVTRNDNVVAPQDDKCIGAKTNCRLVGGYRTREVVVEQAHCRSELRSEVWGYQADVSTRTVDIHVSELRKKLEKNPAEPKHILTVRKTGYRFEL